VTTAVLYDMKGKKEGEVKLLKEVFGVPVNESIVHSAVVHFLASKRRGTASTKTKAEVRGGGVKPWRQKGTGRARVGSIRSPLWRGGGVIFGPKGRDYSYSLPKKVKKLALKIVLSEKLKGKKLKLVSTLELKQPKTKEMVKILSNLKLKGKILVVDEMPSKNLALALRNIDGAKLIRETELNIYDVLAHENLILTKNALAKLEERLKK